MRIFICPTSQPIDEPDVTNRLITAIAEDVSFRFGNTTIDWHEVECYLQGIVEDVRAEALQLQTRTNLYASMCP